MPNITHSGAACAHDDHNINIYILLYLLDRESRLYTKPIKAMVAIQ